MASKEIKIVYHNFNPLDGADNEVYIGIPDNVSDTEAISMISKQVAGMTPAPQFIVIYDKIVPTDYIQSIEVVKAIERRYRNER